MVPFALLLATSWLDAATPASWNRPGAPIPRATNRIAAEDRKRCEGARQRIPASPEDRAVAARGWTLFGAYQSYGSTVLVSGLDAYDGMCRPFDYQSFVFVGGRFVGTLAPAPMAARTEGSSEPPRLDRPTELSAVFNRYTADDALCCPSRLTTVWYEIRGGVVVPVGTTTEKTSAARK